MGAAAAAGPGTMEPAAAQLAGNAGHYHGVRPCNAVQRKLHHRLPAHGRQPALHQAAGYLHGHWHWLYGSHELCGSPLPALGEQAAVLGGAGYAGRHADLCTAERLPPLDPSGRLDSANL